MKNRKFLFIPALLFLSLLSVSSIHWNDIKNKRAQVTVQHPSSDPVRRLEQSTAE